MDLFFYYYRFNRFQEIFKIFLFLINPLEKKKNYVEKNIIAEFINDEEDNDRNVKTSKCIFYLVT